MFRRRRDADDEPTTETKVDPLHMDIDDEADDADAADVGAEGADATGADAARSDAAGAAEQTADDAARATAEAATSPSADVRTAGPLDESEATDDDVDRVDFGSLRVPAPEGVEIRVEVEEATGAVQSISVLTDGSAMQLGVYAAPRKAGIWDEVRTSIAAGITSSGGTADAADGVLGPELHATIQVEDEKKRRGTQQVRFLGVDGPRWFVRGVLSGAAARDDDAAAALVGVLRGCVVVRGTEARAPHEPLPLRLPQEPGDEAEAGAPAPDLNPFKRGPEITEIR